MKTKSIDSKKARLSTSHGSIPIDAQYIDIVGNPYLAASRYCICHFIGDLYGLNIEKRNSKRFSNGLILKNPIQCKFNALYN